MEDNKLQALNKKIELSQFKSVLGSFITGVTVVTTKDREGSFHGFTANSFTSVSLNPPLVSFCLHNNSSTLPALDLSKTCAVSILSEHQHSLSENFAYNKGDKFADIDYFESENFKCPILKNALSWLECMVESKHQAGDHFIYVCRVVALQRKELKNPLAYYSGKYTKINI
jgi:3-hydroxy-9,10-secoandrosta-1,3,5(10)-triene-9,17-dione monooxygenase reductase component